VPGAGRAMFSWQTLKRGWRFRVSFSHAAARLAELRRDAREKDGGLVHGLLLPGGSCLILAVVARGRPESFQL
jgi:hypothetical protein